MGEPSGGISLRGALTSRTLAAAGFLHGFTVRREAEGDAPPRELALDDVFTVSQVHGSEVAIARGKPASMRDEKADAIILSRGLTGAVRVADCVPVLVGDCVTGRAAAIHAGWRGIVAGVIPAALAHLRGKPGDMVGAVGPCIEACCFEVGDEVADPIEGAVPAPGVVVRRAGGKAWVDLATAARAQLAACGVGSTHIERVGACTRCDAERFYSFRRDGAHAGRMFGVITAHQPHA